jgi:hypothetical protein
MRCPQVPIKSHGRKTIATFGDYDGAFNAGIEGDSALMMENWDKTIAINLKGICSACT